MNNTPTRLVVVGAGGHGKVVAEIAYACGFWDTLEFVDDVIEGLISRARWPITGTINSFNESDPDCSTRFILGIGDNETRVQVANKLLLGGHQTAGIVHPKAAVSQFCAVGDGTVIMAGATINIDATIGAMSILNSNCTVEHDCILGDGVHISPGARITGGASVGNCSWIGAGAVVVNQANIGKGCIVGAGSVVLDSVPDNTTVVGNPAREIKYTQHKFWDSAK